MQPFPLFHYCLRSNNFISFHSCLTSNTFAIIVVRLSVQSSTVESKYFLSLYMYNRTAVCGVLDTAVIRKTVIIYLLL